MMDNKYSKELFDNLPPEKKQKVLKGIIRELAVSGIDGCNVRTIAKGIGLSHGSLFHYFASKDDMVHTIIREGVRLQREFFDKSVLRDGDFYRRLESLFHFALDYSRENREIISIWMELSQPSQEKFTHHLLDMEKEAIRALKEMVKAAQKDSAIKKEIDADAAAYLIDSLLSNLIKSVVSDIEAMKFREHFGQNQEKSGDIVKRIIDTLRLSFSWTG